jgi:hypothetical protein
MTRGSAAVTVLIALGVTAYFGYPYSPIPECLHIARMLDEVSESTMFTIRWGIADKAACVVSSDDQRRRWLSSAEVLLFNGNRLNDLLKH